ncbi:uncharacterized protein LOC143274585 [Babylonia areolata]|uniref:uncharacterized protein LOC143274585 n=1 Tax=Babylonia areolata TaxID=304850 RepID=UPI003FD47F69
MTAKYFKLIFVLLAITSTMTIIVQLRNLSSSFWDVFDNGLPKSKTDRSNSGELVSTWNRIKAHLSTESSESSHTATNRSSDVPWFPEGHEDYFLRPWDRIEVGQPFWQSVDDVKHVLMYAAHYDDVEKPPVIRVVGVARYPLPYSNVTCRYYGCLRCPVMLSVSGNVSHFRRPNGRRSLGAFIVCPLPSAPEDLRPFAVSVHKDLQHHHPHRLPVHYSNTTHARQSSRVQALLDQHRALLQEGDLDTFALLWSYVRLSDDGRGVPFTQNSGYRWKVTRCFPAFQKRFSQHVQLAEMVAASRAVGVDHFIFYVETVSPEVNTTLQVLQSRGWAEVLTWNLHVADREVFYKGQFSAIQDCLYRQLRASRYVLTGDVDELFVPRGSPGPRLPALLDSAFAKRPDCGVFLIRNTFFYKYFQPSPSSSSSSSLSYSPKCKLVKHVQITTAVRRTTSPNSDNKNTSTSTTTNSTTTTVNNSSDDTTTASASLARRHCLLFFLSLLRNREVQTPGKRSKVAMDPRRVLVGSVHIVGRLRPGFTSCAMDPGQALLHHYRLSALKPKAPVLEDRTVRTLGHSYVQEVVSVLEEVRRRREG